jgi:hypothetical protein
MQPAPLFDQRSGSRSCVGNAGTGEFIVGGPNDQQRVGPRRNQNHRSCEPLPRAVLPPCHEAENAADQGKRRLHRRAAPVGRLPLGQERAVIERQARRLLRNADAAPANNAAADSASAPMIMGAFYRGNLRT